jgi:hypothetical protein
MQNNGTMITAANGNGASNVIDLIRTTDKDIDVVYTMKTLNIGDRYVLINSGSGFANSNNIDNKAVKIQKGVTLLCPSVLRVNNAAGGGAQELAVQVISIEVNLQNKALSEGRIASLSFIGQGSEFLAERGITEAVASAGGSLAPSPFVAATAGKSRYKTGSHVDISGVSLVAGAAKGFEMEQGNLTAGVFIEHGDGKYDSFNRFDNAEDVKGNGISQYTGGGLLGRLDFRNDYYAEVTVKAGSCKNDFGSKDMKFDSVKAEYEYEAMYIGAHVGGGYKYAISEKLELDASGKYFFINYGEKEVELTTPDRIKFEGINSHKVRLGAKVTYKAAKRFTPYAGLALEYETNAEIKGLNVEAPSIKGISGAGEVGVQGNIGRLTIELGGSVYAGVRTGINGMLKVKYAM